MRPEAIMRKAQNMSVINTKNNNLVGSMSGLRARLTKGSDQSQKLNPALPQYRRVIGGLEVNGNNVRSHTAKVLAIR